MNFRSKLIAMASISVIAFASCKKNDDNNTPAIPVYTVPTTYNFTNVNDTAQLKLILMADQIGAYINTANTTPNTVLSAQKLKDMFNNANSYFNDSSATLKLNASGLKLSDYASASMKTDMSSLFDSIALFSTSTAVASNGVAGVATSSVTATKKLLLSPTGIYYSQLFRKLVQHGIFGYVIINRYLTDSVSNTIDNTTVTPGYGTKMEHNWDQAFGFFGVPITFPTTTTGLKYLGSYCNQINAGMNSNTNIMNAFLKGRAAISNKDLATKSTQALVLMKTLDSLNAAAIVQEMKETDANVDANDLPSLFGTMSEALGMARAFKYNTSSTRLITDAQITQLLALFDSINPNNPNMYTFANGTLSVAQIKAKTDAIRQLIGKVYGFTAAQLALL